MKPSPSDTSALSKPEYRKLLRKRRRERRNKDNLSGLAAANASTGWRTVELPAATLSGMEMPGFVTLEELDASELDVEVMKTPPSRKKRKTETKVESDEVIPDMDAWGEFHLGVSLHSTIVRNLAELGFTTPTPIQRQCIPTALRSRDRPLLGAAETGSGKTLAFGIPLVHRILTASSTGLRGLIVTPTRELAIQIRNHIQSIAKSSDISVVAVVGGMSIEKQRRLIKGSPDIVVGTPGRVWDVLSSHEGIDMSNLIMVVIDEADRMCEQGHFKELQYIIQSLPTPTWQPLVFSATLTAGDSARRKKGSSNIANVLSLLDHPSKPITVDLCHKGATVAEAVVQAQVRCPTDDKEAYLYYALYRLKGRVLVFVNSIDTVSALKESLSLLNLHVYSLHGKMQQRSRLKTLDRFLDDDDGIMIATDVAARGLDIKGVAWIAHMHLPTSADVYVHRSGRAGRAGVKGASIAFVGPSELKQFRDICNGMGMSESDIIEMSVDQSYLRGCSNRTQSAKMVAATQRRANKQQRGKSWIERQAEAAGLDVDGDSAKPDKRAIAELKVAKQSLRDTLATSLVSRRMHASMMAKGVRVDQYFDFLPTSVSNGRASEGMDACVAIGLDKK